MPPRSEAQARSAVSGPDIQDPLAGRLQDYLQQFKGAHARITSFVKFPAGLSWITASFRLEYPQAGRLAHEFLIIKLGPQTGLMAPYSVMPQVNALAAFASTPVPVPRVLWYSDDPCILGAPFFITDRMAGEPLNPFQPALGLAEAGQLPAIGRQFTAGLAQIHRLDWRATPLALSVTGTQAAEAGREQVRFWHGRLRQWSGRAAPFLEWATSWLLGRCPPAPALVIVHGDYRPGNFLLDRGAISAILDWEMVHLGDPHEDLGWTVHRDFRLGAMIKVDDFLALYTALGGYEISRESLRYYAVFNLYKFAIITMGAIRAFESGSTDVRMASMGMGLPRQLQALARAIEAWDDELS